MGDGNDYRIDIRVGQQRMMIFIERHSRETLGHFLAQISFYIAQGGQDGTGNTALKYT
jgi:hypothetical protein